MTWNEVNEILFMHESRLFICCNIAACRLLQLYLQHEKKQGQTAVNATFLRSTNRMAGILRRNALETLLFQIASETVYL
jgi:hypothetical protein